MSDTMTTEIERHHDNGDLATGSGSPHSLLPVPEMNAALKEYDARRINFREWLLSKMTEGVHYGVPPGCDGDSRVDPRRWKNRPSLYKAGADLLCDLLMLDPRFNPDLDMWKMLGGKEGMVIIRCQLISRGDSPFFPHRPKGEVIGEGHGAGQAGVKKRDGNGAIKIAEKCAKVGAVIHTLGISDLFTQDLEDAVTQRPTPSRDVTAPKVAIRADRAAQPDGPPKPSNQALNDLFADWREWAHKPVGTTLAEFGAWAQNICGTDKAMTSPAHWTVDAVDHCRQAISGS